MPSKRLLLFPFEMKKLRLRKAESRITQPSRTELEPPVSEGTPRPFLGHRLAFWNVDRLRGKTQRVLCITGEEEGRGEL